MWPLAAPSFTSMQIDATVVHPANVPLVDKLIAQLMVQGACGASGQDNMHQKPMVQTSGYNVGSYAHPAPLQTQIISIGADDRATFRLNYA